MYSLKCTQISGHIFDVDISVNGKINFNTSHFVMYWGV